MDEDTLAAMAARAAAATPGPWYAGGDPWGTEGLVYAGALDPHRGLCVADCDQLQWEDEDLETPLGIDPRANAAFIAASRTDVLALVAEVRRLRAELMGPAEET